MHDNNATIPGGKPHYEASVQRDLERIRQTIHRMATLAGRALRDGMTALQTRNRQLAYAVIIRDQHVDRLEREVDRLCLEFLVRQQPAGQPLRLAYTALKLSSELERVGDYAESIAHQAAKLSAWELDLPLDRLAELARIAETMLADAVRAYLTGDARLAWQTIPTEDTADVLKAHLRRELVQRYKDNRLPFEALDPCLLITRRLERITDQARNICAETLYLCTGEYAKHPDAGLVRILFLDRFNAGASLLAEALGESLRPPQVAFQSAGLEPRPVPAAVVEFARAHGLNLAGKTPKPLAQVPELDRHHVVVALHPEVKRLFPPQLRKIIFLDWPVEDPAAVEGPPEQVRAVCDRICRQLKENLLALVEAIRDETATAPGGPEAPPA